MTDVRARDLRAYDAPYYLDRYRSTRHQPAELFDSEKHFLDRCVRPGISVLDIGCACGGFYNILTSMEPTLRYQGIDISPTLVGEARATYPGGAFDVTDGTALHYPDRSFDLVQTWGVLLHEPEYRRLIAEAWRVTRHNVLFDVRLQLGQPEVVDRERAFVLNPGGVKNFYIVPEAVAFVRGLLALEPRPATIEIYGYEGRANRYTTLPADMSPLYMAGVRLEKSDAAGRTTLHLDLPDEAARVIRAALAEEVHGAH